MLHQGSEQVQVPGPAPDRRVARATFDGHDRPLRWRLPVEAREPNEPHLDRSEVREPGIRPDLDRAAPTAIDPVTARAEHRRADRRAARPRRTRSRPAFGFCELPPRVPGPARRISAADVGHGAGDQAECAERRDDPARSEKQEPHAATYDAPRAKDKGAAPPSMF